MQQISEFLVNYWQYISIALVVIIDIVLFLFKKRTKIYDASAYSHLITLVDEVEDMSKSMDVPMTGRDKLKYVVDHYFALTGLEDNMWNRSSIICLVERILSTPTKKGGPGREKDV